MTNWTEIKVGELGRVITGKTPKTSQKENYGGVIPFITPSDDMTVKHLRSTAKTLTEVGARSVKNSIIPKGAICVSCIGSDLGKVVIATETSVTNQQINSIIVDENKFDIDFIYYSMVILGKVLNHNSKTSTAVPIVNKSDFSNYVIKCPDLETQRVISSILTSLDTKIEVNSQINGNLSEQAQAIYQNMFAEKPTGVLADICAYSSERIDVAKLTVETYYSTENMMSEKAGVTIAAGLPSTGKTPRCLKGDTAVSNIRPYFKKIAYCYSEVGCSADVLCFHPKKANVSEYLYETLFSDRFFDYMVAGSKGTKMPRGDKQQIMQYPIHVPSDEELASFTSVASPLLQSIYLNQEENKCLVSARDNLLPKLMSGELDVSEIDL